jgi:hypothetical protein
MSCRAKAATPFSLTPGYEFPASAPISPRDLLAVSPAVTHWLSKPPAFRAGWLG